MILRVAATSAALAVAGSASAQIRVIFSNLPGAPSNAVPSLANGWKPGTSTSFDRPNVSPDGLRWAIGGFANEATTADRVLIIGTGTTSTGSALLVREGAAAPFDATRTYSFFDPEVSINNAGQLAIAADLEGGVLDDQTIVVYNVSGAFERLIVREDQLDPTAQFATNRVGSAADGPCMLADGRVMYRCVLDGAGVTTTPVAPLTADTNEAVLIAPAGGGTHSVLLQEGVTPVEPGAPAWDNFGTGDFRAATDGVRWLAQGDDSGDPATDGVLVLHNGSAADVAVRESDVLYGGVGVNAAAALSAVLSRDGSHWIANFTNSGTSPLDFVLLDGARIAGTDEDITPGAPTGEVFDDSLFLATFFSLAVNSSGSTVVGGVTDNVDLSANAVLVLNGTRVIAREGDPVDVNGNGLNDDNVFIDVFNNFDAVLTDSMLYYFTADLRDGAGTPLNAQAFLVIDLSGPVCDSVDFNNDTLFPDTLDIDDFLAVFSGGACSTDPSPGCNDVDFNNDGLFPDTLDIDSLLSVFSGGACI